MEVFVTEGSLMDFEPQTLISVEVAKKLSQTQSVPKMIGLVNKPISTELVGNVLVLEDLQDPGNVGTLLRSALSFGYQSVVLTPNAVDFTNDKVVRSSQGALFHLSILELDLETLIKKASKQGYTIVGSVVEGGQEIRNQKVGKHLLILGHEGQGLSPSAILASDVLVRIPTAAFESLNVAIAGSILMYELNES